jgi:hypothetical protein
MSISVISLVPGPLHEAYIFQFMHYRQICSREEKQKTNLGNVIGQRIQLIQLRLSFQNLKP